jgi:hypothetical protein
MGDEEEVARKSKAMEKIEQSMVLLMSRTKHEVKNGKNTFFLRISHTRGRRNHEKSSILAGRSFIITIIPAKP